MTVICGKGNNGGDGLVAARVLAGAGHDVRVLLLGRGKDLKGEAAEALERLRAEAASVDVEEITDESELGGHADLLRVDVLIDAVVGTGFKPPLRGIAAAIRELVKALAAQVVAVDLPSGWDADSTEESCAGAFRADAVVTFTAPKPAHMFGDMTRWPSGTGRGGGDWIAGCGGGLEDCDELDRDVEVCGGGSESLKFEQGEVWPCAGGGRELR